MNSTPTCPNCGAKFSHNVLLAMCRKCGLPDEVAKEGKQAIAIWKRSPAPQISDGGVIVPFRPSKRERKLLRRSMHSQSRHMHKNKPGRVGVKRAAR